MIEFMVKHWVEVVCAITLIKWAVFIVVVGFLIILVLSSRSKKQSTNDKEDLS